MKKLAFLGLVLVFLASAFPAAAFDNQANLMAEPFPHWLVRSKEVYAHDQYQDTLFEFIDVSDSSRLRSKTYPSDFFGFADYDNYHDPLDFAFSDSEVFVYRHWGSEIRVFSWNPQGELEFRSSVTVPVGPIPASITAVLDVILPWLDYPVGMSAGSPVFSTPRILFAFEGLDGVYFVVGMSISLVHNGAGDAFRLYRWTSKTPTVDDASMVDPETQALEAFLLEQMDTHDPKPHYPSVDTLKLHTVISLWQRAGGDLSLAQKLVDAVTAAGSLSALPHHEWTNVAEVLGDRVYFPEGQALDLTTGEVKDAKGGPRTTDKDWHITGTSFWWQHFFRLDDRRALLVNDFGREGQLWIDTPSGLQTSPITLPEGDFGRPPTRWARSNDGHWFYLANSLVHEVWATPAGLEFYSVGNDKLATWVATEDKVNLEKAYSYFADPGPALEFLQKTGKAALSRWFIAAVSAQHPGPDVWASANPVFAALERRDLDALKFFLKTVPGLENVRTNSWRGVGTSPLAAAARAGSVEACRLLLAAGADVEAREEGRVFPRNALSEASTTEVAKLLREAGVPTTLDVKLTGKVVDTHVRLRAEPSLTAPVLRILEKGEPATIRAVTAESTTIAKKAAPWVQVTDSQGRQGWVWAPFVNNPDWYDN